MTRFILCLGTLLACVNCFAGTWGAGGLDNDDALDWLELCIESKGSTLIYSELRNAATSDALDATDGARAVVAAEIVAAAKGKPSKALAKEVIDWIEAQSKHEIANLGALARVALNKVKDPQRSELRQLWIDSEDEQWSRNIAELEARLQ